MKTGEVTTYACLKVVTPPEKPYTPEVSCPEGYIATPEGDCVAAPESGKQGCNSKKFRGCLAEKTKQFEDMYKVCNSMKFGEDYSEDLIFETVVFGTGVGWDVGKIWFETKAWLAGPEIMINLEKITRGFGRGALVGFLAAAAWETYKLHRDYPEWAESLDLCMDTADKLKTVEDDKCAMQSGCWPGQSSQLSPYKHLGEIMKHSGEIPYTAPSKTPYTAPR
jgi:hypothetical protein